MADKFLSGTLNFGAIGEKNIMIFPNEKKEKDSNQPDYNICIKGEDDKLKRVGALWLKKKQDKPKDDSL